MKLFIKSDMYGGRDQIEVSLSDPGGSFGSRMEGTEVPFDVAPGDYVYAVVVTYTTGSTFGRESGNKAFAGLVNDANKAHDLAEAIKDHERWINSSAYRKLPYEQRGWESTSYLDFEGERIYTGTWTGYFESIDYVDVVRVAVGS
jgi:hypothetical protein